MAAVDIMENRELERSESRRDQGATSDPHYGATEFARSALALVPMLRPFAQQHPTPGVCLARLARVEQSLAWAVEAQTGTDFESCTEAAKHHLDALTAGWQQLGAADSDAVFGLYRGMCHSLNDGQQWWRDNYEVQARRRP